MLSEELGGAGSEEMGGAVSEELGGAVSEELGGAVSEELDGMLSEELGGTPSEELGGMLLEELGGTLSEGLGEMLSEVIDAKRSSEVVEGNRISEDAINTTGALVVLVSDTASVADTDDTDGGDRAGSSPRGFPRPGRDVGQAAQSSRCSVPVFVV